MKNWDNCLEEKVHERKPDQERARSLLKMARIRLEDNNRREVKDENVSLIVESYWEILKQLLTGLLSVKGYKSYSQECLITFLDEFYDFRKGRLELLDQLRRLRNDIDYRGKFLDTEYLDRNEDRIKEIVDDLIKELENELD